MVLSLFLCFTLFQLFKPLNNSIWTQVQWSQIYLHSELMIFYNYSRSSSYFDLHLSIFTIRRTLCDKCRTHLLSCSKRSMTRDTQSIKKIARNSGSTIISSIFLTQQRAAKTTLSFNSFSLTNVHFQARHLLKKLKCHK